ncbi:Oidioi.mRNA.OKI2018_I69.PAR.g13017.t1.cds [Oikopleura dioica]|uniref:Oidioi.mRNA.OKI2018_I69.PAR.g13017.t1.cds n=1 Tax=Oikopleura dioica TaxID=34765 RepID=A0ABN7S2S1_OIKDI|nr:Oidioi.mRNA.OKI2018_I69.PAR.g13017.t1.cds [Oikopleura dioica]
MMRTIRRATRSMKSSKEKVETDGSGSATSSSQSLTRQLSTSNPELNCKDSNHRRTNSYPTRSSRPTPPARDPRHHQMPRNLHKESLDNESTQFKDAKDYVERSTQTENTLVLPKPMFSKKELKMPYFCCLYLLIGFNCCAFAHRISQTTVIHLIADAVFGLAVAVFLRRFVGLNLFKIQDKVTERAILTMVTQIRIAYYFIAGGLVYDWSLFLFVLSVCILFLDYVPKSWQKIVLPFELKTE